MAAGAVMGVESVDETLMTCGAPELDLSRDGAVHPVTAPTAKMPTAAQATVLERVNMVDLLDGRSNATAARCGQLRRGGLSES
jgi:hypothetical protein